MSNFSYGDKVKFTQMTYPAIKRYVNTMFGYVGREGFIIGSRNSRGYYSVKFAGDQTWDIHENDLEKVEEEPIVKRIPGYEEYFYINANLVILSTLDLKTFIDGKRHNTGNYFTTEEDAQEYLDFRKCQVAGLDQVTIMNHYYHFCKHYGINGEMTLELMAPDDEHKQKWFDYIKKIKEEIE